MVFLPSTIKQPTEVSGGEFKGSLITVGVYFPAV